MQVDRIGSPSKKALWNFIYICIKITRLKHATNIFKAFPRLFTTNIKKDAYGIFCKGILNYCHSRFSCKSLKHWGNHCVKSVQICSFFWSVFSCIRKDFFSECDQIRRKLRIWSHLLKKSIRIQQYMDQKKYLKYSDSVFGH